jgi:hypothetical protein
MFHSSSASFLQVSVSLSFCLGSRPKSRGVNRAGRAGPARFWAARTGLRAGLARPVFPRGGPARPMNTGPYGPGPGRVTGRNGPDQFGLRTGRTSSGCGQVQTGQVCGPDWIGPWTDPNELVFADRIGPDRVYIKYIYI